MKLNKKVLIKNNPLKISSPGQLKLHYSPGIPIRLNVKKVRNNEAFLLIKKKRTTSSNHYFLSKKSHFLSNIDDYSSFLELIIVFWL